MVSNPIGEILALLRLRPLVPAAVCMMLGVLFANRIETDSILLFAGLILSCAVTSFLLLKKKAGAGFAALFGMFFLGAFLMTGTREAPNADHISQFADKGALTFEAIVNAPPVPYPDHTSLTVSAERILLEHDAFMPTSGLVRLNIGMAERKFRIGDKLKVTARLREIPRNGTPGVFDYSTYWKRRGVMVRGSVRHEKNLSLVEGAKGFSLRRFVDDYRTQLRDFLATSLPEPGNRILMALLLGEKHTLPESVFDAFSKGGVSHLLAISGMHIGTIYLVFYLLVLRLARFSVRLCRWINIHKFAAMVALLPAFAYAELAGWRISTLRAFCMVAVFALSLRIGRQRDLLSAISAAAIVILIIWPFSLLEPAFQLSFVSVTAIAMIAPRVYRFLAHKQEIEDLVEPHNLRYRLFRLLLLALSTTVGAWAATVPIAAYHFGSVSIYAFAANLIMIPLYATLIVPMDLAGALLFSFWQQGASVIFHAAHFFVGIGYWFSESVGRLPHAQIWLSRPVALEIFAYYGLLCCLFYFRRRAAQIIAAICIAVLVAVPFYFHLERKSRRDMRLTMIDVGQGLSQLIEFPGGAVWLVDGGGSRNPKYDTGRSVVAPFLRTKRIRTINRVVNSHPHPDHFGGLDFILRTFDVGAVTLSAMTWDEDDRFEKIKALAKQATGNLPDIGHSELKPTTVGPATVRWIYPPIKAFGPKDSGVEMASWSVNDRSIVIRTSFGDCSFLLPGDVEKNGEAFLLESGVNLQADVLISPHHGSRTSSSAAFLGAVRPEFVGISVGRYNWYGLPAAEVLDRYNSYGIAYFRTDLSGAVEFRCDGQKVHAQLLSNSD